MAKPVAPVKKPEPAPVQTVGGRGKQRVKQQAAVPVK